MNLNKKGFTLVELLVAATILGILVVFATNSYRNSVAETRWTQAKAMADQFATAVQQSKLDYEWLKFTSDPMSNSSNNTDCPFSQDMSTQTPSTLIDCGYLENSSWNNEFFSYYICDYQAQEVCAKMDSGSYPIACVQVNTDAKLPAKYLTYSYCVYAYTGGVEYIN